jgi:hypothetical protein
MTERNTRLFEILDFSGVTGQLISIFDRIHQLSITLQYAYERGHAPVDPLALEEDTMILQRELLAILLLEFSDDGPDKACLLGALLYLKTLTRPLASWTHASKALAKRLRSSLEDYSTRSRIDSRLLGWMLLLGMMSSVESTLEHTWFVDVLRKTTSEFFGELPAWPAIVPDLESISWVSGIHDESGKAHWTNAMATPNDD